MTASSFFALQSAAHFSESEPAAWAGLLADISKQPKMAIMDTVSFIGPSVAAQPTSLSTQSLRVPGTARIGDGKLRRESPILLANLCDKSYEVRANFRCFVTCRQTPQTSPTRPSNSQKGGVLPV